MSPTLTTPLENYDVISNKSFTKTVVDRRSLDALVCRTANYANSALHHVAHFNQFRILSSTLVSPVFSVIPPDILCQFHRLQSDTRVNFELTKLASSLCSLSFLS